MTLGHFMSDSTITYNGVVGGTEVEVTDNADSLIYSITLLNLTAAIAYLQIIDADAADVTIGTTTPTFVIAVPASGSLHCSFPKPIRLTSGFTIASTTARGGATGANQEVLITYATSA